MTKEEFENKLTEKDGRLYYNGDLNLFKCDIESLPNNLTINGSLNLYNDENFEFSNIELLPDNLIVKGSLDLSCTKIKSLPNNLTVYRNLYASRTKIESLPNDLIVMGNLDLYYTQIKSLPNNLKIYGWLNISDTNIETLPKNLYVNSWLNISRTKIKYLPDDLIVGETITISYDYIKYNPDKIGFLFSKSICPRYNIACYNIKRDSIVWDFFSGNLNDFIDEVYCNYPNKNNEYRIKYDEFIDQCIMYKEKIQTKIEQIGLKIEESNDEFTERDIRFKFLSLPFQIRKEIGEEMIVNSFSDINASEIQRSIEFLLKIKSEFRYQELWIKIIQHEEPKFPPDEYRYEGGLI